MQPEEVKDDQLKKAEEPQPNPQPTEVPLSKGMIEKINAINEEFKQVQNTLNSKLQLMLDCYAEAMQLADNQYWTLSPDNKAILIHDKN